MSLKNDIKIMHRSMVCEDSNLKGDITISSGCVIHPSTTIIAESGPIIIGENCIVEEYATIIHRIPKGHPAYAEGTDGSVKPLIIGPDNIFEVGCTVEALKIGERNVFECKCYVSADVTVTNGCVIGAGCRLVGQQVLPEKTIVQGKQCQQREAIEKQRSQMVQLDYLRKILPNYHHLKKATYDPKKVRAQV
ncbi:dynactin subunit 6 [Toxorhynchites rutilus septentrionalis]|uniref:dynactin subunit 6 n=1 Tax=Toxorhynchites rutilus septentrionalis TaxID=329112 RepID=UPI002479AD66|nr:dynactin subunit 6 [Toxorhynchites rutilus septentrionalis]